MKKIIIFSVIGMVLAAAVVVLLVTGKNFVSDDKADMAATEVSEAGSYAEYDVENQNSSDAARAQYRSILLSILDGLENGWSYTPSAAGYSDAYLESDRKFAYVLQDFNEDGHSELAVGEVEGSSFRIVQIFAINEENMAAEVFTGDSNDYLIFCQDGTFAEYFYSEDSGDEAAAVAACWTCADGVINETETPENITEKQLSYTGLN